MSYLRKGRLLGGLFVFLVLLAPGIFADDVQTISRERAVEIARAEVNFEPQAVEVTHGCEDGANTWIVTLRSTTQPDPLGRMMIVTIDRQSGRVLSLARN